MKKKFILLALTCLFIISIKAADLPSAKREYDPEKTALLQSLLKEIHEESHAALAPQVISLVRDGKANPNLYLGGCGTLLAQYVAYDNQEVVACLLNHNADPNIIDPLNNTTPLYAARSAAMVELLLIDWGAQVNHRLSFEYGSSLENYSAFNWAILWCRPAQVLAALCQAGLDPNRAPKQEDNVVKKLLDSADIKRPMPTEKHIMKSIGTLYWHGVPANTHLDAMISSNKEGLDRKEQATRLKKFIATLPDKQVAACKELALLVASAINHPTVIGKLVSEYAGTPGLSPQNIDAWDQDIHSLLNDVAL